jgi:hypothetical protein
MHKHCMRHTQHTNSDCLRGTSERMSRVLFKLAVVRIERNLRGPGQKCALICRHQSSDPSPIRASSSICTHQSKDWSRYTPMKLSVDTFYSFVEKKSEAAHISSHHTLPDEYWRSSIMEDPCLWGGPKTFEDVCVFTSWLVELASKFVPCWQRPQVSTMK